MYYILLLKSLYFMLQKCKKTRFYSLLGLHLMCNIQVFNFFRSANPFFVLFLRSIVPLKSVWFLMQYVRHDDRFGTELSKFCTFEVTEL